MADQGMRKHKKAQRGAERKQEQHRAAAERVKHREAADRPGKQSEAMHHKKYSGTSRKLAKWMISLLYTKFFPGLSRHEQKAEEAEEYRAKHGSLKGHNPAKTRYIHSVGSLRTYMKHMWPFADFCVEAYHVRYPADIQSHMVHAYLWHMYGSGKSLWTVYTAASAINKALDLQVYPRAIGLPPRTRDKIKKNRDCRRLSERMQRRYGNHICVVMGTGMRRMSVLRVRPCDFRRGADGLVVAVYLVEKGGRARWAPVLNTYRERITAIVDDAIIQRGKDTPLFTQYSKRISSHWYRAHYCAELLHQLEGERGRGAALFGGQLDPGSYICLRGKDAGRKAQTQGHDTDLLACVSGAMGHRRVDVIFRSYLYLY